MASTADPSPMSSSPLPEGGLLTFQSCLLLSRPLFNFLAAHRQHGWYVLATHTQAHLLTHTVVSSSGLSALILGATGATGRHILNEVLSSDRFTKISEIGRKVTPKASLPNVEKLEQKTVNFDKIEQEGLKDGNWDVILIAYVRLLTVHGRLLPIGVIQRLGTTRKVAGSDEAFQKIDREYVARCPATYHLLNRTACPDMSSMLQKPPSQMIQAGNSVSFIFP